MGIKRTSSLFLLCLSHLLSESLLLVMECVDGGGGRVNVSHRRRLGPDSRRAQRSHALARSSCSCHDGTRKSAAEHGVSFIEEGEGKEKGRKKKDLGKV